MTRKQKQQHKAAARKRAAPVAPIAPKPPSTPTIPAFPPAPARPLMDDLVDVLTEQAVERDPAAPRTRQQAMLDKLIGQAVGEGDVRAAQFLANLKREADEARAKAPETVGPSAMDADDEQAAEALLQAVRDQALADHAAPGSAR